MKVDDLRTALSEIRRIVDHRGHSKDPGYLLIVTDEGPRPYPLPGTNFAVWGDTMFAVTTERGDLKHILFLDLEKLHGVGFSSRLATMQDLKP